MITLITGAPGAGKTCALVDMIRTQYRDRPCFVSGIPDFQLPHIELVDPTQWPTEVPDGALIVIDEVQRVWRPAGPTARVTEDIALLETHRHRGLDFLLVTQQPALIRTNVRALVGRHVHLRDVGVLGRWWYEWPECNAALTWKTAPVKKRYALPKKVFSLYKSASMHVKPVRNIPPALMIAVGALLLVAGLVWYATRSISSKTQVAPAASVLAPVDGAASSPARSFPGGVPVVVPSGAVTAQSIQADFQPRIRSRPETAPAYDHLRVVKAMPIVTGGFVLGSHVECHTDQGTRASITDDECRAWLANPPYNPYKALKAADVSHPPLDAQSPPAAVSQPSTPLLRPPGV